MIRSGYGTDSRWYRRAQRTRRATSIDANHRYPVTIEDLEGEAINREVDRAYAAKYAGQGQALRQVGSPEVRRFTMRLMPRGG